MTPPPRLHSLPIRHQPLADTAASAARPADAPAVEADPAVEQAGPGTTLSDLLQREVAHGNPKLLDFVAQLHCPPPDDESALAGRADQVADLVRDAMALGASAIAGVNALPGLLLITSPNNRLFRECAASVGADASSFTEGTRRQIEAGFNRMLGESTRRNMPVSMPQAEAMMCAAIADVVGRGAGA